MILDRCRGVVVIVPSRPPRALWTRGRLLCLGQLSFVHGFDTRVIDASKMSLEKLRPWHFLLCTRALMSFGIIGVLCKRVLDVGIVHLQRLKDVLIVAPTVLRLIVSSVTNFGDFVIGKVCCNLSAGGVPLVHAMYAGRCLRNDRGTYHMHPSISCLVL